MQLNKLLAKQLREFEEKYGSFQFAEKVSQKYHHDNLKLFLSTCQRQIIEEVREEINNTDFFGWNEDTQRMINDKLQAKLKNR